MPTILRICLSRKVTKDFQSAGYGLEIQTELPASAVGDPREMAEASDELFRLGEDLLAEQLTKAQADQSDAERAVTVRRSVAVDSKSDVQMALGNGSRGQRR